MLKEMICNDDYISGYNRCRRNLCICITRRIGNESNVLSNANKSDYYYLSFVCDYSQVILTHYAVKFDDKWYTKGRVLHVIFFIIFMGNTFVQCYE